ncbi:hypothetical protein FA15DRAFT_557622, partial [Coprinopsis marcescibilis]
SHKRSKARSYENLYAARRTAEKSSNFNSAATRARIQQVFEARFEKLPYDWQMDVTEALLVGLDSVVIAGTGCGKTMPFMMPLLNDSSKKAVIISPLKVLQLDQVARFRAMGITAAAVN